MGYASHRITQTCVEKEIAGEKNRSQPLQAHYGLLTRDDKKANSTRCSQAVTHPSTNRAQCCLTSVIGRELVCSTII